MRNARWASQSTQPAVSTPRSRGPNKADLLAARGHTFARIVEAPGLGAQLLVAAWPCDWSALAPGVARCEMLSAVAAAVDLIDGGPPPRPDGKPPRAIARRCYLHLQTIVSANRWADRARAKLRHKTSLERAATISLVSERTEGDEAVSYQQQANAELNTMEAFGACAPHLASPLAFSSPPPLSISPDDAPSAQVPRLAPPLRRAWPDG